MAEERAWAGRYRLRNVAGKGCNRLAEIHINVDECSFVRSQLALCCSRPARATSVGCSWGIGIDTSIVEALNATSSVFDSRKSFLPCPIRFSLLIEFLRSQHRRVWSRGQQRPATKKKRPQSPRSSRESSPQTGAGEKCQLRLAIAFFPVTANKAQPSPTFSASVGPCALRRYPSRASSIGVHPINSPILH